MLRAGDRFPEFDLEAHDGTRVTSAGLSGGQYLLFFYPKADTPWCTIEACGFRDAWSALAAASVVVLGVSYDSPAENHAFAEKYGLPFKLLSDRRGALARATGASDFELPLGPGGSVIPVPKRISYLVGADGRVVKAYPDVDHRVHAAEVLKDARSAIG